LYADELSQFSAANYNFFATKLKQNCNASPG